MAPFLEKPHGTFINEKSARRGCSIRDTGFQQNSSTFLRNNDDILVENICNNIIKNRNGEVFLLLLVDTRIFYRVMRVGKLVFYYQLRVSWVSCFLPHTLRMLKESRKKFVKG